MPKEECVRKLALLHEVQAAMGALMEIHNDEVAALLKVSKSWVYEHTRSRRFPRAESLPYVKIGKYVRFRAPQIQEFLSRRARVA